MIWVAALTALVAMQRISEVWIAQRNTRMLIALGAKEFGAGHYPFIIAMHTLWLIAIVAFLPRPVTWNLGLLTALIGLEIARIWVMTSLGPYFTTRIISLDNAPLVRHGPYRFMRHPNYAIVVGEIAILPLTFGEIGVAVIFSIVNACLLTWRIRIEDRALLARRRVAQTGEATVL